MSAIIPWKTIAKWGVVILLCLTLLWLADKRGYERRDAEARIALAIEVTEYQGRLQAMQLDASQREASIQSQLAQVRSSAARHKSELEGHLREQESSYQPGIQEHCLAAATQPQSTTDPLRPLLGHAVLDAYTLRVLNEARAGGTQGDSDPGPRADEAGRATAVTGTDLALNDLEVVRLYHELAARHSGLVDWVNHQCINPAQTP